MPKAAVDEDCEPSASIGEVRPTREGTNVTPISKLVRTQPRGDGFLWRRLGLANTAHELRSLRGRQPSAALEWVERLEGRGIACHPESR
jgi:hypothetical protein